MQICKKAVKKKKKISSLLGKNVQVCICRGTEWLLVEGI